MDTYLVKALIIQYVTEFVTIQKLPKSIISFL